MCVIYPIVVKMDRDREMARQRQLYQRKDERMSCHVFHHEMRSGVAARPDCQLLETAPRKLPRTRLHSLAESVVAVVSSSSSAEQDSSPLSSGESFSSGNS